MLPRKSREARLWPQGSRNSLCNARLQACTEAKAANAATIPAALILAALAVVLVLSKAKLPPFLQQLAQQPAAAAQSEKAEVPLQPLFREMPVVVLEPDQQVWLSHLAQMRPELHRSEGYALKGSDVLLHPCDERKTQMTHIVLTHCPQAEGVYIYALCAGNPDATTYPFYPSRFHPIDDHDRVTHTCAVQVLIGKRLVAPGSQKLQQPVNEEIYIMVIQP